MRGWEAGGGHAGSRVWALQATSWLRAFSKNCGFTLGLNRVFKNKNIIQDNVPQTVLRHTTLSRRLKGMKNRFHAQVNWEIMDSS